MRKFIQNKLKEQKGLTLIELLAVIVILAIIAAIAIPAIGNIIENSRVGAAKSDALNILSGAELYLTENPDAFTDTTKTITLDELEDGGYIEDLGGFEGTAAVGTTPATGGSITSITQSTTGATAGQMELNATAVIGGVTVVFNKATKDQIIDLENGTGDSDGESNTENTITVTR